MRFIRNSISLLAFFTLCPICVECCLKHSAGRPGFLPPLGASWQGDVPGRASCGGPGLGGLHRRRPVCGARVCDAERVSLQDDHAAGVPDGIGARPGDERYGAGRRSPGCRPGGLSWRVRRGARGLGKQVQVACTGLRIDSSAGRVAMEGGW